MPKDGSFQSHVKNTVFITLFIIGVRKPLNLASERMTRPVNVHKCNNKCNSCSQYINSEKKTPEASMPQSTYRFLRTVWSLTYNHHVYTLSQKNILAWTQFKSNNWKLHFIIWLFDEANNDLIKTLRPYFI